jgi:hypothetical protein
VGAVCYQRETAPRTPQGEREWLGEVVELAGLDALDPGVHLSAGEEHDVRLRVVAVAHRDAAIRQERCLDARTFVSAEAGLAPGRGVQVRHSVRTVGADEAPRLFTVVQVYRKRVDGRITAWGMTR